MTGSSAVGIGRTATRSRSLRRPRKRPPGLRLALSVWSQPFDSQLVDLTENRYDSERPPHNSSFCSGTCVTSGKTTEEINSVSAAGFQIFKDSTDPAQLEVNS